MKKIKKFKIKQNSNNEYSNYHYFIPKSEHIKFADARTLDTEIGDLRNQINELEEKTQYLIDKAPLIGFGTGENITLRGCANSNFRKFKIEGNSKQEIIEGVKGKEVTGEYITINDVDLEDGRITVNGNSEQEKRSGKNKYNATINKTVNNVSSIADIQDFILNGTSSADGRASFRLQTLKAGTYTVNLKYINGSFSNSANYPDHILRIWKGDSWDTFGATMNVNSTDKSQVSMTFTLEEDTEISLGAYYRVTDIYNNIKYAYQIVEGSNSDFDFEPYGASPSPDYPSEIKTVGDNLNLLDIDKTTYDLTINLQKEGEYLKGNNVNQIRIGTFNNSIPQIEEKLKSGNYTISYEVEANTNVTIQNLFLCVIYEDDTQENIGSGKSYSLEKDIKKKVFWTLNVQKNVKKMGIVSYLSNSCDIIVSKVKIEEGIVATPYSPYNQGSVKVTKCNKNILPLENKTSEWDKAQISIINNELTIKPNSNGNIPVVLDGNVYPFSLNKGTTITISWVYKNGDLSLDTGAIGVDLKLDYDDGTTNSLRSGDIVKANQKSTSSQTITLEKNVKSIHWYVFGWENRNAKGSSTYNLQLEIGSIATPFEQHQEQSYILPIQQEMLQDDSFTLGLNKKEIHTWGKKILTGEEDWDASWQNIEQKNSKSFALPKSFFGNEVPDFELNRVHQGLSSHFPEMFDTVWVRDTDCIAINSTSDLCLQIRLSRNTLKYDDNITTSDLKKLFQDWLKAQYNAGTPVVIYYQLATPINIECTEEQNEILNQLYNTTIYTPTTNIYSTDKISPNITLKYNYVLPSPSPEVPSEVESCGNNINLLPSDLFSSTSLNGVNYTNKDGIITVNGTATEKSFYTKTITLKAGTYTLNGAPKGSAQDKYCLQALGLGAGDFGSGQTFTIDTEQQVTLRIMVWKGITVNNIIFKPKLIQGTEVGEYSKYGQGCVKVTKCNKNIMPINIGTNYAYTSSGIKHLNRENGTEVTRFDVRKGQIIKLGLKLISKPTNDTTFSFYFKSNDNNVGSYAHMERNELNQIYEREYTAIEDGEFFIKIWGSPTPDIFEFQLWAELDTLTDYVQHEEQSYTVPTQQPMRSVGNTRDTFIKKNNKWYERHYIARKIFDGTEEIGILWNTGKYGYYIKISDMKMTSSTSDKSMILSNMYKVYTQDDLFNLKYPANGIACRANKNEIIIRDDNITTLSDLITNLSANKPYIDYMLDTPLDIECTEEQNTILDKIEKEAKTYKNITHIFSTDEISPIFKIIYKKDIDALIADSGV